MKTETYTEPNEATIKEFKKNIKKLRRAMFLSHVWRGLRTLGFFILLAFAIGIFFGIIILIAALIGGLAF